MFSGIACVICQCLICDAQCRRVKLTRRGGGVCHTAAPHIFWGLWALVQSQISDIQFDWTGYARERLQHAMDALHLAKHMPQVGTVPPWQQGEREGGERFLGACVRALDTTLCAASCSCFVQVQ
jgi:hypothetical protein